MGKWKERGKRFAKFAGALALGSLALKAGQRNPRYTLNYPTYYDIGPGVEFSDGTRRGIKYVGGQGKYVVKRAAKRVIRGDRRYRRKPRGTRAGRFMRYAGALGNLYLVSKAMGAGGYAGRHYMKRYLRGY